LWIIAPLKWVEDRELQHRYWKVGIGLRHNSIYKSKLGWRLPETQLQLTVD
jgi:hypothetical protein